MGEDTVTKQEGSITPEEYWTTDGMKARLLEAANGKLIVAANFPSTVLLNETWRGMLEDIFYQSEVARGGRTTFYFEHPEENARIVKTNAARNVILVSTKNLKGENTHVSIDSGKVKPPEIFLGILHKHPVEALFSSEDILPMIAKGGQFVEGVVTPSRYYLTFRASDSTSLSTDPLVNRGYMLAMAKTHHAPTSTIPPNNVMGFSMTPKMFKELRMPLYEGLRGQAKLTRVLK